MRPLGTPLWQSLLVGVAGGLVPITLAALARWLRTRSRTAVAELRIHPPSSVLRSLGAVFGVRYIRDGKDAMTDATPLMNRDVRFKARDGELVARWRIPRALGCQFKCFAEVNGGANGREVLTALADAGYLQPSQDGSGRRPHRYWFHHPDFPTCETLDGYVNDYYEI